MITHSIRTLMTCAALAGITSACTQVRGTGDLGIVVERAAGSVLVVETTGRRTLAEIDGLGDLSHASAVYSRDARYAYVFGRDGGLTKVDLLQGRIERRIVQAGNSIGGAISQDGALVAVSNYDPGGVRIFDAGTLEPVAEIPAVYDAAGARSKVVGLVDAPGRRFVFSLYDAGEIWIADLSTPTEPRIQKFKDIGEKPYDALITPEGRFYVAGLYGEDGLALLDLWTPEAGVRRISVGGSFARAALGALIRAAEEVRDHGSFDYAKRAIPDRTVRAMMAETPVANPSNPSVKLAAFETAVTIKITTGINMIQTNFLALSVIKDSTDE